MRFLMLTLLAACGPAPTPLTYAPTCADVDDVTLATTPTWSGEVGALVADRCASCHGAGGIAPFPLDTYADAAPMAGAIAAAVESRRMPPWLPASCGDCQTWAHDRSLTDLEIATLRAWSDGGAPEGTAGAAFDAPAPRALTRIDATIDPGADYTPPEAAEDTYRCFLTDAPSATDTFLTGYEVLPGESSVVHHVIVYQPVDDAAVASAVALDAGEAGEGWTCYGGTGVYAEPVAIWAPGAGATVYPEGTGLPLAGGRRLVLQVHYNVENGTSPDRTRVDLTLAPTVATPALLSSVATSDIALPPGEPAVQVDHVETLDVGSDFRVWGLAPHMHETGANLVFSATSHGEEVCLVDVPVWDFHWQGLYFYEEPLTLAGDSELRLTCVYDTTGRTETTYAGEGTADEMCLVYAYVSG
ncbi:MAG: hypothetical protein V4850_22000 [Myxococcota bacterium]